MFVQHKSRPNLALSLILLGLAITFVTLTGCVSTTTPDIAVRDETQTPSLLTSTTPDAAATPDDPSSSSVPTTTPDAATPDATQTATRIPPVPTLEALDFRTLLPAAPPGFGELSNHLIFFSDRSGRYQLYQISLDGSDLVQLTQNPDYDIYDMEPAWSTDGKIGFTTRVNGWWEVFILYPERDSTMQLTDFEADSWSLAWSPDGQSLAFVSNATGDDEIYLFTLDGGALVNLTKNPLANDFLPVWSPDGQSIAFVSDREGREAALQELEQDIFVMASDGSQVTRLTESEGRDTSPNWSPDGCQIAFVSERDGNFEVYVMNADGSDPVRLTRSAGYEWSPTWAPDGELITFTSTRDHEETYDLYVMAPDGSNQTRLTFDPANDIIPRWWP
jgi:Tol biopolymer transport system component